MTGQPPRARTPSGLAEDLIPLLRARIGAGVAPPGSDLPAAPPESGPEARPEPELRPRRESWSVPATSVLELADRLQEPGIAPAAAAVVRVQQFVAFRVGEDEFAIPIASVQEILRVGQITRVPQSPHYICGVTNVRGRLLPVIGVAEFLGRGGRGLDKDSRIVMVELRGRRLGLLVDRATDVLTLPENMIEAAPAEVLGAGMEYIVGVGKRDQRMIFIMDLDRAFGTAS